MAIKEISLLLKADDQASAALKSVGGGLDDLGQAAKQLAPLLGTLGAGLGIKEIVDTAVAWDGYKAALTAVTGSAAAAQKELDYVWETADKLGASVDALAPAWVAFAAATKGTVVEGQAARDIFEAISQAAVKLGLSSDQATGALNAVQQMISKGKVSAEELRGQLGERLPGAFQLFAAAAGISTAELDELLQKGKVGIDLLPKFAAELEKVYGTAGDKTAQQALNEFGNAITKFKLELADAGVLDVFMKAMKALQEVLDDPRTAQAIAGLGESFESIISGSGPALILAVEGIVKVLQELALGVQVPISLIALLGDTLAAVAAAIASAASGDFQTAWNILQDPTPAQNFQNNLALMKQSALALRGETGRLTDATKGQTGATRDYLAEVTAATTQTRNVIGAEQTATDQKKKLTEASKEAAKAAEKQRTEAAKLALEMEKIASNERIKLVELAVKLKTADIEAETKKIQAAFESINKTVENTGQLIGDLFGMKMNAGGLKELELDQQIKLENDRRQEALDLQKKLVQEQIRSLQLRNDKLAGGSALIEISMDGVEPELELVMWKMIERVQARVNEQAAEFLIGWGVA